MSGKELSLAAAVGTVDLCLKYGQQLVEKYGRFKATEAEFSERSTSLVARWERVSLQLQLLKQIWSSLHDEHQYLQEQVLQTLLRKLQLAVAHISNVQNRYNRIRPSGPSRVKRRNFAFAVKESLENVTLELQTWNTIFDPAWYLIVRVSNPLIYTELVKQPSHMTVFSVATRLRQTMTMEMPKKERIFLPESGIAEFDTANIQFSVAKALQREGLTALILDHAECHPDADKTALTKDVRTLVRRLRNTDPLEFGLLECFGVIKNESKETDHIHSFDFLFKIPNKLQHPRSLRDHLCSETNHSLNDVFAITKRLAISVSYVHTLGFVHRNIQPETILVFDNGTSPLGWSALVGFRSIRMADDKTLQHGDPTTHGNLYRHPAKQGTLPEKEYTMQHDIYSLGVCMLEIGLWKSFIQYDESCVPCLAQNISNLPAMSGSNTKDAFVSLAKDILPQRMGNKFTSVVLNCLTCMDPDNRDFGDRDEFRDREGVLIGVRYIEKILLQLDAIAI